MNTLIKELIDAGWTQREIAKKCQVAQSTVSDLYRGVTTRPSYQFVAALKQLHKGIARRKFAAQHKRQK